MIIYAEPGEHEFNLEAVVLKLTKVAARIDRLGDTYDNDRVRTQAFIEELKSEGTPVRNPQRLYHKIEERRLLYGPSIDVAVILNSDTSLHGHIARRRIYLKAIDSLLSDHDATCLTIAIQAAGAATVRVGSQ